MGNEYQKEWNGRWDKEYLNGSSTVNGFINETQILFRRETVRSLKHDMNRTKTRLWETFRILREEEMGFALIKKTKKQKQV